MPIYELRCQRCGHEFEELVFRRSEIEELACPECGEKNVGLLLSAFATGGSTKASGGGGCGGGSGFT